MRQVALLVSLAVAACASDADSTLQPDEGVCPTAGEFGPTDCAIVRGVAREATGALAVQLAIRVDSIVPPNGFLYTSNTVITDKNGHFEIAVGRDIRFEPRTIPDTARIELKSYPGSDPKPHDPAKARAWVLMYFAELGAPVKVSVVTAVFDH